MILVRIYIFLKEKIDYFLGGAMGLTTGAIKTELLKYWYHLTEEDSLFHLFDACFTTALTTAIGAFMLHFLHRFLFKKTK